MLAALCPRTMLLALCLVLLPQVFCTPRIDAHNWNATTPLASTPLTRSSTPPTAVDRPTKPSPSLNATAGECTINIPNANVDYWLSSVLEYATTSLVIYHPNTTNATSPVALFSATPATETLHLPQLLSDYGFTDSLAASTSVVTVNGIIPIPSPGIIATSALNDYVLDPMPVATATFGAFTATSATPIVYFSAYEVETQIPGTDKNGRPDFTTSTATYELPSAYVYEYGGKGFDGQLTATGDIPKDFYRSLPQSSCVAGTWQASVTVLIVVELVYSAERRGTPFIVHIESSVLGLEPATTTGQRNVHLESSAAETVLSTDVPEERPNPHRPHIEVSITTTGKPGVLESTSSPPGFAHVESSATTTKSVNEKPAQGTPSRVAVGISVDIPGATDLPGLLSLINSFKTNIGHVEFSSEGPSGTQPSQSSATAQAQVTPSVSTNPISLGPSSVVVIGSQTVKPGAPPITVDGTPVSLAPSATAIVVGGSTIALPASGPISAINIHIGNSMVTAALPTATGDGIILPGGGTLLPGSVTVIDGETISLAPSGTAIVVGGITSVLPQIQNRLPPPLLTVGTLTITGNAASQYFFAPQETLTPGGAITVSGTVISLGSSADYLVVGGSTQPLPAQTLSRPSALITPPPVTVGNGIYNPVPGSGTSYLIGGSLLTPGGVITVAGTTVSLALGASYLVVNGATTTLLSGPVITNPPLLTISTSIFTALPGDGTTFVIDGQTLTPGGIITVSGTVISLSPSATALVFGSSGSATQTETLFPATRTSASTAQQTSTSAATGAQSTSSHGAAYTVQPYGNSISLFMLALGYLLSLI